MKKNLAFVFCACLTTLVCSAQTFVLVTELEAAASFAAGEMMNPRNVSQPGAPQIELLSPDTSKAISAPTNIELRFIGNPPSEPRPETFRVLYGGFRIDITHRLVGVAKITKDGIKVKDAVLPKGRHQLSLIISDSLGRQSNQLVAFTVE